MISSFPLSFWLDSLSFSILIMVAVLTAWQFENNTNTPTNTKIFTKLSITH
ncbi:hypothetical protein SLEP1_g36177 [Rubroshorea leprosula]|uniref:ATP synthase F0 subunit 8 n=1 Tax=Rubroshorea leprosula TaxID=152421 RepID=A0AAV5KR05_9ROSI|nr:hypothetical protein SLEP1_g36177 [Rubroshorea leprosula]